MKASTCSFLVHLHQTPRYIAGLDVGLKGCGELAVFCYVRQVLRLKIVCSVLQGRKLDWACVHKVIYALNTKTEEFLSVLFSLQNLVALDFGWPLHSMNSNQPIRRGTQRCRH